MKLRFIRYFVAVLFSCLLMWFLFRDTQWGDLLDALLGVDPGWLSLSILMSFASLLVRVQRWSHVVRASLPARFSSMYKATQIGLLVNTIIPARVGDVVRAYVLSVLEGVTLSRSLALVTLDRINDVFALIVVLLIASIAFPLSSDIQFAAGAFGNTEAFTISSALIRPVAVGLSITFLLILAVLVLLYFKQSLVIRAIGRFIGPMSRSVSDWAERVFEQFAAGMHVFRSFPQLIRAAALSLSTWGLVAISFWCLMKAFNLDVPWYGPVLMLAVLGVFTSVTVTPGMIGQYHVPVVASLLMVLPQMDLNDGKAFAIVAHLVAVAPPVILGAFSLIGDRRFRLRALLSNSSSLRDEDRSLATQNRSLGGDN